MFNNEHKRNITFNYILEERKKNYFPFNKQIEQTRKPRDLIKAILDTKKLGRNPIITEIKYRSPTKKNQEKRGPEEISIQMIKGGACAISVLTEPEFFGGSLDHLREVARVSSVPVLRKDFIFHPTQIPESYYYGADTLLLISSFFTAQALKEMIDTSRAYGMEPLVEVHSPGDIERATDCGAKLFGINNRDKDTLEIDISRTARMSSLINGVRVSASGIENPSKLKEVLLYADAALIGTSIMGTKDLYSRVMEFVEA